MDVKQTIGIGFLCIVVGVLSCWIPYVRQSLGYVFWGGVALLLLVAGVLFVFMGVVQVREDRANAEKERREAEQKAMMAASES